MGKSVFLYIVFLSYFQLSFGQSAIKQKDIILKDGITYITEKGHYYQLNKETITVKLKDHGVGGAAGRHAAGNPMVSADLPYVNRRTDALQREQYRE